VRCNHRLRERFTLDRGRFEEFARAGFASAVGLDEYMRRHQAARRGAGRRLALVFSEAKLADAIGTPTASTSRFAPFRQDEVVVFVRDLIGRGNAPVLATRPIYVHSTRFASFAALVRGLPALVCDATALAAYNRRLQALSPAVADRRCLPRGCRRGCRKQPPLSRSSTRRPVRP
jgi:hypothetical protein